jgi:hypothetical protein
MASSVATPSPSSEHRAWTWWRSATPRTIRTATSWIRAFDGLEHRETSQNAFYSSDAWREGPREAIVGQIETYVDMVLWLSEAALAELRESLGPST